MKLAWLSEGGYTGKIPREQTVNAGVLWAWMVNLETDHYPILGFDHAPTNGYDYVILQVPKTPGVREQFGYTKICLYNGNSGIIMF